MLFLYYICSDNIWFQTYTYLLIFQIIGQKLNSYKLKALKRYYRRENSVCAQWARREHPVSIYCAW